MDILWLITQLQGFKNTPLTKKILFLFLKLIFTIEIKKQKKSVLLVLIKCMTESSTCA